MAVAGQLFSHIVKRIALQQWPVIQVFVYSYSIRLPLVMWHTSHLNVSHPTHYVAYLHRHSLLHHGFCLTVSVRIVAEEEHQLWPWHIPRNENDGLWGRVTVARQNPLCGNECRWSYMLRSVWDEIAFKWDVCRFTHGCHIEQLWTKLEC
jgi:hypothetical protein